MRESEWKDVVQKPKRLLTVGRQKFWKPKFHLREFIPHLVVVLSCLLICPLLLLSWPYLLVGLVVFLSLYVFHFCRFKMLSSRLLSLRPFSHFKEWEKVFNQMLSEGEKAIPILLQILQARRKYFLIGTEPDSLLAIFVLGRLKAREAVEPLIEFLKSKDIPRVEKVAAIWALGEIGDQKAIPALIPLLGDFRSILFSQIETQMAFMMKGIGLTEEEFKERFQWQFCDWAEEALMKLNPEIVTYFKKVVEEQDKDALFELAKKYRSETIAALIGLLNGRRKDWVFNTVWALKELKAVDALPDLRRIAWWTDSPLREHCQKVITELKEFSKLPS